MNVARPMSFWLAILAVLGCVGCGGGGSGGGNAAVAVASPVATAPTPTTTPTLGPAAAQPMLVPIEGLASIPSNFDIASQVLPSTPASSAAPDTVGAFRFICQAAHLSYDDPIVYPGQPGASHLHQFFGNTLTDASSTYASLRTTGDSTCMGPLNRSAYWIPAMLNGHGGVVRPDYVVIYYKRFPKTSPYCTTKGKACVDLPRGLRFVFGYNMINPSASPTGAGYFDCQGTGTTPGHYATLTEARAHCPVGTQVGAVISAPECWNGTDLDSPDHRSHVAYQTIDSADGQAKCPTTHPFIIPHFSLGAWYTTDATLPDWYLSSDRMPGMADHEPGQTLHSDWFGAWDDPTMRTWTANCIDRLLTCADGLLGDGTIMKRPTGFSYVAEPRVVAVPPRP